MVMRFNEQNRKITVKIGATGEEGFKVIERWKTRTAVYR